MFPILVDGFLNNCLTIDNNSSLAFGGCNANRAHPIYGCIANLTSHFLFQYVKEVNFKIAHEPHGPWNVATLTNSR